MALQAAARDGNLERVRQLVQEGASLDAVDARGWTALSRAANRGHTEVVRFLAVIGAAVNAVASDGWTPVMRAARGGHFDVVRLLVEHGAAVDAVDSKDGRTPLMRAAVGGHLDIVRFLINQGADPNIESAAGDTAMSIATRYDREGVVRFLMPLIRYRYENSRTLEEVTKLLATPPNWLIAPFEVEVESFADVGHIGGDFRGKWLDADVVVKLFLHDSAIATFSDEVSTWHKLRHPNVIKLYGACDLGHHFFVCEYASNGSLPEYLKACDVESRTPWKFLHETALGLEFLHERKIVHRHLRGSNILVGDDGLAKLSNFGLSATTKWSGYGFGSWLRWVAPEALHGEETSFASDIYSLGMCIVEAVTGDVPWKEKHEWMVRAQKIKRELDLSMERPTVFSPDQWQLVLAVCRKDPRERVQISSVVKMLERFASMEVAHLKGSADQRDEDPLADLTLFHNGLTVTLWNEIQTLVGQSDNGLHQQIFGELTLIFNHLSQVPCKWSLLEQFHRVLVECRGALDPMSQQNRVYRLSSTRATDSNVHGLHRRVGQILRRLQIPDQDAESREAQWRRQCREQMEVFVSEVSETLMLLDKLESEDDLMAFAAFLRAELQGNDAKYTAKQLSVLRKTYDEIESKSLTEVELSTRPEWFIPWFELDMSDMVSLGVGGFGSVFKAQWLDSQVVVKKLEMSDGDARNPTKRHEMRQMFEREVEIWFGLSHPHVVRLFGACHVGRPFFVCEFAPNGTLVDYLTSHPDELWSKLREAALGVQYLHARGIVHGDLKGNNIVIGSDGKAKVTDFGLSGANDEELSERSVSQAWHWVAPECILGQKPSLSSDVYSLGMCMIEALRVVEGSDDCLPWVNSYNAGLQNAAVKFLVTRKKQLPPRPRHCPNDAWSLIERMCKHDVAGRIQIMTVVDELEKMTKQAQQTVSTNHVSPVPLVAVSDSVHEMVRLLVDVKDLATTANAEVAILRRIYHLLWSRFEKVADHIGNCGQDDSGRSQAEDALRELVDFAQPKTQAVLDSADAASLIEFTELALGGYSLHRRLDKFLAAHFVGRDINDRRDWTSLCNMFLLVVDSPRQDSIKSLPEIDAAVSSDGAASSFPATASLAAAG